MSNSDKIGTTPLGVDKYKALYYKTTISWFNKVIICKMYAGLIDGS